MSNVNKAMRIFLRIAMAAKRKKQALKLKLEHIKDLEKDISIAEGILDGLAETRKMKVSLLVKVNTRIQHIKNKIHKIKENLKDPSP